MPCGRDDCSATFHRDYLLTRSYRRDKDFVLACPVCKRLSYVTTIKRKLEDLRAKGLLKYGAAYFKWYEMEQSELAEGVTQGKNFANLLRAVVHLENEKFANHMREYGQTRKVVGLEDNQSFESTDQAMELSLNEEGQILVSKEGMAAWVKEVSRKYIDC